MKWLEPDGSTKGDAPGRAVGPGVSGVGDRRIAKAAKRSVLTSVFDERIHALEVLVVKGIQHAHAEFKGGVLAHFDSLDHGEVGGVSDRILRKVASSISKRRAEDCLSSTGIGDVTHLARRDRNYSTRQRIAE